MKTLSLLFAGLAFAVWAITGLWGSWLCLVIIWKAAGFWGAAAAVILFPITFAIAPFYAGFANGEWFPAILNYGGVAVAGALYLLAHLIAHVFRPRKQDQAT